MFDDSIVSLASGKSLLGYIYWRTKQDAVALQLLEGSCPLLWEYHSAIKSPDSYVSSNRHFLFMITLTNTLCLELARLLHHSP